MSLFLSFLCARVCLGLGLLVDYTMSPHPSNQSSERSHVSTTALQCLVLVFFKLDGDPVYAVL